MLQCYYCTRLFFDEETISIRVIDYTEWPYHRECLERALGEDKLLRDIFGDDGPAWRGEIFERVFRKSQVAGDTGIWPRP